MGQLHIRQAKIEDCNTILKFIQELADYEKLSHEVIATEAQLKKTLFGGRTYAEVLIAEIDGNPAGFALFFHNYSTFLAKPGIYLEDVYVNPEFRGQGIGQRFFKELAKLAKERDCGRLEWSVLNWNEPAINFYQQLGARPKDEWTVYRIDGDKLAFLCK